MYTLSSSISSLYVSDEQILMEGIELVDLIIEKTSEHTLEHAYTLAKLDRETSGYNIAKAENSRQYHLDKATDSFDYIAPTEEGHTKIQIHHTTHPVSGKDFTYGRVSHHVNKGDETLSKFTIHKSKMLIHDGNTLKNKVIDFNPK